ncbi:glycine zipper 2TM domain-containing protein [Snodgrassella sp. CFCC 13594]|uniref:glycine zipper domain-containing protein n=1 Tax=Snodgrassella sp. CFCC 13594 TaxID=1775559 RepID=UPI000829DBA5|nr:glycine zipper 2TM domain-containing protein [Snodgrassella sp. CFCC 13594]
MKIHTRLITLFGAIAVASAPLSMAEVNRTTGTIVGAAVGGVVGNAVGNDINSTLLGAAAGGLLGNLLSQNNRNYNREGYYNNRYYYGGREFRKQQDYRAYREAVRRDMLRDNERNRYAQYQNWRARDNRHMNRLQPNQPSRFDRPSNRPNDNQWHQSNQGPNRYMNHRDNRATQSRPGPRPGMQTSPQNWPQR